MSAIKNIWDWFMNYHHFRVANLIIYIFYFVPSDYNAENIPMKIAFAWGATLLAWDFFTKRVMFKQPYWYVLLALCVSYFITIVLNYPYSTVNNLYNLVYLATSLFLFYPVVREIPRAKLRKQVQVFNEVAIALTFVLAILSLLTFFFSVAYQVPTGTEGVMARQGFLENRLFGLYTSPNIGAMFGYVSVILMLVNNYLKRGDWKKFQKLYIANLVVQYLFYVLASSRGTQITLVGFAIFLYLIWTYKAIAAKQASAKSLLRNFALLAVAFFGFNIANTATEWTMSYIPPTISYFMSPGEEMVNEAGETVLIRRPIEKVVIQHSDESAEVSSGRLTIWEAAFQLVKQRPLFGVGDPDVYRSGELSGNLDESKLSDLNIAELRRAFGNMHNTYVAVLLVSGAIGFTILAAFVILILKDNILFIGDKRFDFSRMDSQIYIIIFAFLLSLFVNDLVENHLIFNNRDVMGLVFWSYLGLTNLLRLDRKAEWEKLDTTESV